jgi:hypothetical protein
MLTIKGRLKDGVVYPSEPVAGYDQEEVLITFLNEQIPLTDARDVQETDYDSLTKLLEECQMDTGIEDLAHQHDHYLHGTPKRVDP